MPFIQLNENTSKIEATVPNKWMEIRSPDKDGVDGQGDAFGAWCRKTTTAGVVRYIVCLTNIKYGLSGVPALKKHAKNWTAGQVKMHHQTQIHNLSRTVCIGVCVDCAETWCNGAHSVMVLTVSAMLQDPELLQLLAHRTNIHKVLKQHPLFGAAAVYIAKIVDEEHSRDPARPARNNVYSLDRMSDEEDEGGAQQPRASQVPHPQITASQVAAALAAATASAHTSAPGSSSGATAGSSGAQGSAPGLFPDLLQQRMMSAQNSALEAQLQQLRDMGITDENMARQALSATNGDLQAALDIIFADEGGN